MLPTLTPTLVSTTTDMPDTPMPLMACTTARGLLRLSPRLRLTHGTPMAPMVPTLMPTTGTTVMPGPTGTATDTGATEATTGDKFSGSEVQSRNSKRTSLLVI